MTLFQSYPGGFGIIPIDGDINLFTFIVRYDYFTLSILGLGPYVDGDEMHHGITYPTRYNVEMKYIKCWHPTEKPRHVEPLFKNNHPMEKIPFLRICLFGMAVLLTHKSMELLNTAWHTATITKDIARQIGAAHLVSTCCFTIFIFVTLIKKYVDYE